MVFYNNSLFMTLILYFSVAMSADTWAQPGGGLVGGFLTCSRGSAQLWWFSILYLQSTVLSLKALTFSLGHKSAPPLFGLLKAVNISLVLSPILHLSVNALQTYSLGVVVGETPPCLWHHHIHSCSCCWETIYNVFETKATENNEPKRWRHCMCFCWFL